MKEKNKKWVWIGIIAAILLVGLVIWRMNRSEPKTYVDYKVGRGNLEITTVSTATVLPRNRLEIKPPVAGRIEEVLIREGEKVKKGQIIAWMSSTERAALLDAARSQDENEVKKWEALYRPTPIIAPLDGEMIKRSIESGQTVTNGDAILVMSDKLIFKAQVDETDMALIRLKQKASVILDAFPGEKIPAIVEHIAFESVTTNNVTTYPIDVLPKNDSKFMRAGMTANVTFSVEEKENVIIVPVEFISYTGERPSVLKKVPSSIGYSIVNTPVKLGLTDGQNTEIEEGLTDDDVIFTEKLDAHEQKSNRAFGQPNFRGNRKK